MPTVNVYHQRPEDLQSLDSVTPKLKRYFAQKLTCGDRQLAPEEISVRYIGVEGSGMIGNVEVEITAHAYPERVEKQDDICRDVASYIEQEIPSVAPVKVWLKLSELGHSW